MMNVRALPLLAMICVFPLAGCSNDKHSEDRLPGAGAGAVRYFASPQEAVEIGSWLLSHEDWPQLASYYDLRGADVIREQLESGALFVTGDGAERAYRQPFPPAFRFDHVEDTPDKNVKKVVVTLVLEQPDGTVQRATDDFRLRKSNLGYQLLPE